MEGVGGYLPPVMTTPQKFSSWMLTHESECRNLVRYLFVNNRGAIRFGLDADDVWHEAFRRLSGSDRLIGSSRDLSGLVKTTAARIICDLARRYAIRRPLFDKPEITSTRSFSDDPRDPHPSPEDVVLSEEQVTLLSDVAASDPAAEAVFNAICDLIDSDVAASIANISRHLHIPYGKVRKAHLKLQKLIRSAIREGRLEAKTNWLS